MSKKERIAKKEEERRARMQQERESIQMGNILHAAVYDFVVKETNTKRRRSAEQNVSEIQGREDKR